MYAWYIICRRTSWKHRTWWSQCKLISCLFSLYFTNLDLATLSVGQIAAVLSMTLLLNLSENSAFLSRYFCVLGIVMSAYPRQVYTFHCLIHFGREELQSHCEVTVAHNIMQPRTQRVSQRERSLYKHVCTLQVMPISRRLIFDEACLISTGKKRNSIGTVINCHNLDTLVVATVCHRPISIHWAAEISSIRVQ